MEVREMLQILREKISHAEDRIDEECRAGTDDGVRFWCAARDTLQDLRFTYEEAGCNENI